MKYRDINERYTEIVNEWLKKGYVLNTATMSGSQGEVAHIDLTDGNEVIRILLSSFNEQFWLKGMEIVVGRASSRIKPHMSHDYTLWNNELEVLYSEKFYEIADGWRGHEAFYGTKEDAMSANEIRQQRYEANGRTGYKTYKPEGKLLEIARKFIRRKRGIKRVDDRYIEVRRCNYGWVISYKGQNYTLR